jgi:uncharacterized coiled-coil DUF342 family protein
MSWKDKVKKIEDEQIRNDIISAVENAISTAESQKTEGIPTDRFNEVISERNNLRADLAETKSELDGLRSKINEKDSQIEEIQEYKTKYQEWKDKQNQKQQELWNQRKKMLEVEETDPHKEKIDKIIGKFNMDDNLKPEQVEANNKMFDIYDEVGFFNKESKDKKPDKPPIGGSPSQHKDIFKVK